MPERALLDSSGLTYRYPGAGRDALRERRPRGRARRVRRARGPLGLRQDHAAARRLRPRAALPRRRGRRARSRSRGARRARARPGRARRRRRLRRPGPRDAGRLDDRPRRARAAARAARRAGGVAARAPSRRWRWRSAIPHLLDRTTDTLSGGELQRVALAAALVAPPAAGPARRADLAARPRRRRRADLAAAPAQRGVGDGGRALRAPARALPRRRRPGGRDARRARSPSTARPRGVPRVGARARPRAGDPGGAAVRRSPACARCRSACKAARERAGGAAGRVGRSDQPRRDGPSARSTAPRSRANALARHAATSGSSSTPASGPRDVLRGLDLEIERAASGSR